MTQNYYVQENDHPPLLWRLRSTLHRGSSDGEFTRNLIVTLLMGIALIAFEIFNFDTTRFALNNLIGEVKFAGVTWSAILAVAFCSIDGAGLFHLFGPEQKGGLNSTWYLMGAWLLGATMNAVMTWWAVSVTLLDHQFGNEVLSRETLLAVVPIFVAVLVWLTRVLFIGALSMSSSKLANASRRVQSRPAHIVTTPPSATVRKRHTNEPLHYRQPERMQPVHTPKPTPKPKGSVKKRTSPKPRPAQHTPQKPTPPKRPMQQPPQPRKAPVQPTRPRRPQPPKGRPTMSRPTSGVRKPGVQAKPYNDHR